MFLKIKISYLKLNKIPKNNKQIQLKNIQARLSKNYNKI